MFFYLRYDGVLFSFRMIEFKNDNDYKNVFVYVDDDDDDDNNSDDNDFLDDSYIMVMIL